MRRTFTLPTFLLLAFSGSLGTPAAVLAHPGLRATYVDRVIEHRDRARAAQPGVAEAVRAALGDYAAELWPGF